MKKSLIIPLGILILAIAIVLIFKFVIDYSLNLHLTSESIKVNMYDTIYLENYVSKASDSNRKNLKDNVKISIECDEEDVLDGNILYVKSISPKVVTYTLENKNRTIIKKMVIKVITDPNDSKFKPNYDKIDSESVTNYDDVPTDGGETNLSEEQLKYLKTLQ